MYQRINNNRVQDILPNSLWVPEDMPIIGFRKMSTKKGKLELDAEMFDRLNRCCPVVFDNRVRGTISIMITIIFSRVFRKLASVEYNGIYEHDNCHGTGRVCGLQKIFSNPY